MGRLNTLDGSYSKERIETHIRTASESGDNMQSIAMSNMAIAKTLYNIMVMIDNKEGCGK